MQAPHFRLVVVLTEVKWSAREYFSLKLSRMKVIVSPNRDSMLAIWMGIKTSNGWDKNIGPLWLNNNLRYSMTFDSGNFTVSMVLWWGCRTCWLDYSAIPPWQVSQVHAGLGHEAWIVLTPWDYGIGWPFDIYGSWKNKNDKCRKLCYAGQYHCGLESKKFCGGCFKFHNGALSRDLLVRLLFSDTHMVITVPSKAPSSGHS